MPFNKDDLIFQMKPFGIIPVFYHSDADVLLHVVDVAYRCGLRIFEFMPLFSKEAIPLKDWGLIEKVIFANLKNIAK